MENKHIEVEGDELLLESSEGHYAIIPKRDAAKVKAMIGCDNCINAYIQTLPKEHNYAEDGTIVERRESFTKGGRWRILKYLKNEKTHEEGGVDIQFNTEEAPEEKVIAEEGLNIGESEINTKNTDIIESDPVKPVKDINADQIRDKEIQDKSLEGIETYNENDPAIIKANNQIDEGFHEAIVKKHMESLSDYDALSKEMFEHIKKVEGNSGDTTGVAETGKYGLTTDTYNHIKNISKNPKMSEEDAIKYKIKSDYDILRSTIPNFDILPDDAKKYLMDYSYQAGSFRNKDVIQGLKNYEIGNDISEVFKPSLNMVTIGGGRSSKGTAVRRAKAYNSLLPEDDLNNKISKVQQDKDGRITYYNNKGETIYTFFNGKAPHESSKPGTEIIK